MCVCYVDINPTLYTVTCLSIVHVNAPAYLELSTEILAGLVERVRVLADRSHVLNGGIVPVLRKIHSVVAHVALGHLVLRGAVGAEVFLRLWHYGADRKVHLLHAFCRPVVLELVRGAVPVVCVFVRVRVSVAAVYLNSLEGPCLWCVRVDVSVRCRACDVCL